MTTHRQGSIFTRRQGVHFQPSLTVTTAARDGQDAVALKRPLRGAALRAPSPGMLQGSPFGRRSGRERPAPCGVGVAWQPELCGYHSTAMCPI